MTATKTKVTNVSPSYIKGFNVQYWVGPGEKGKSLIVLMTPVDALPKQRMEAMGKPYIKVEELLHPNIAIAFAGGNEEPLEPVIARCLYKGLELAYRRGVIDG